MFGKVGSLKPWERIKADFDLQDDQQFYWLQIHSFSTKKIIIDDKGNINNLALFDHRIIFFACLFFLFVYSWLNKDLKHSVIQVLDEKNIKSVAKIHKKTINTPPL